MRESIQLMYIEWLPVYAKTTGNPYMFYTFNVNVQFALHLWGLIICMLHMWWQK